MSENARKRRSYDKGCAMVYELVARWKPRAPAFRFPPRDLAFIASLADCGEQLATNAAACELVAEILAEALRRRLDDVPTAMMLRASLELQQIPISHVAFAELGIKGTMVPIRRGPPGPDSS